MSTEFFHLSAEHISSMQNLLSEVSLSEDDKKTLLKEKNNIYVLTDENKLVGYAIFHNSLEHSCDTHIHIHIFENYQRKGYGKLFFSKLLEEALKKEISQIKICCHPSNIAVQKMLENFNAKLENKNDSIYEYWIDLKKEKTFRYSIKAIIIKDNKLLVERCDYGRGKFSKLPGGGQNWGETVTEALIRECKEELNIEVFPQKLVLMRDYIAKNHPKKIGPYLFFHQVEPMFLCQVKDYSRLGKGITPDGVNQEITWLDLDTIENSDFYPKAIIPYLKNIKAIKETVYLGDVN